MCICLFSIWTGLFWHFFSYVHVSWKRPIHVENDLQNIELCIWKETHKRDPNDQICRTWAKRSSAALHVKTIYNRDPYIWKETHKRDPVTMCRTWVKQSSAALHVMTIYTDEQYIRKETYTRDPVTIRVAPERNEGKTKREKWNL